MKRTKNAPLTDRKIDWLEEVLMEYGHDDAVLCFSELDGLLTAIVSGSKMVSPEIWLNALWVAVTTSLTGPPKKRWCVLWGCVFSI